MLRKKYGIAVLACLTSFALRADIVTSPDQIANPTVDNFDQVVNAPLSCGVAEGQCLFGYTQPLDVGKGAILTGGIVNTLGVVPQPSQYGYFIGDSSEQGGYGIVGPHFSTIQLLLPHPVSAAALYLQGANGFTGNDGSVTAFDAAGNVLGGITPALEYLQPNPIPLPTPDPVKGYFVGVSSDTADISYLWIYGGNLGENFDDLTFGDNAALVSSTPEPNSCALAGVALFMLGFLGVHRRSGNQGLSR